MTNLLTKYLRSRPEKWGQLRDLVDDKKLNRKINYATLLIELVFIIYALNSLYGCPCAIRTCGITHFDPNTHQKDWEAANLDCSFVQSYISKTQFIGRDSEQNLDGMNPKSFEAPWNTINTSGLITQEMPT